MPRKNDTQVDPVQKVNDNEHHGPEYTIIPLKNTSMCVIRSGRGGPLPKMLQGSFIRRADALQAIASYKATKE